MLDLHLHLDGSLPVDTVRKLMVMNYDILPDGLKRLLHEGDIETELRETLQVSSECNSLAEYLKCFDLPLMLLQRKDSIRLAVTDLLEELKAEGLRYVEIRFAPQLHSKNYTSTSGKLMHETEMVRTAIEAAKEVPGIKCNFILCMMRGAHKEHNQRTLILAESFKNRGVVAVDLAGSEADFKTSLYRGELAAAKEMGLNYTIHAGEAGSVVDRLKSIYDAITFGTKRIGHGVAMCIDKDLKALCKERGIGIECCPTSNIQTKAFDCIEYHPIYEFMSDGLLVSVNTDNRTVSGTTLEREFDILKLKNEEKKILIQNAIDMAFLSKEEKKEIFPEWVK